MLCVGRAPAVAEKNQLASGGERFGGSHGKCLDTSQQLIGEALLYPAAFVKLGSNLFNMRAHDVLNEDDFPAVAGDAACGVS